MTRIGCNKRYPRDRALKKLLWALGAKGAAKKKGEASRHLNQMPYLLG